MTAAKNRGDELFTLPFAKTKLKTAGEDRLEVDCMAELVAADSTVVGTTISVGSTITETESSSKAEILS